ncbi:hypothetical protein B0H67DRAFT_199994 [Lasiosphaeris hirsuta]|uniref:Uncharacterized protein n=1 Tax=Lasiosphaeris hirsuta TaxID=260670 RepID=A0AA40ARL4_9PEZI|nr:hypothetical protein B0H67DRAFT_199994 [Lasiosphaeris hirsuta]
MEHRPVPRETVRTGPTDTMAEHLGELFVGNDCPPLRLLEYPLRGFIDILRAAELVGIPIKARHHCTMYRYLFNLVQAWMSTKPKKRYQLLNDFPNCFKRSRENDASGSVGARRFSPPVLNGLIKTIMPPPDEFVILRVSTDSDTDLKLPQRIPLSPGPPLYPRPPLLPKPPLYPRPPLHQRLLLCPGMNLYYRFPSLACVALPSCRTIPRRLCRAPKSPAGWAVRGQRNGWASPRQTFCITSLKDRESGS